MLADRCRVARDHVRDLQARHASLLDAPVQERLCEAAADGSVGEPGVDVGLAAVVEVPSAGVEEGQEGRALGETVAGLGASALADRSVLGSLTQAAQDIPGGEAFQEPTVFEIVDRGEPLSQRCRSIRCRSTGGRTSASMSRSRRKATERHGVSWLRPSWVSGTSPRAQGLQHGDNVRLRCPIDPDAGSVHLPDGLEQRDELGADGAGAVVQQRGQRVGQDAVPADPGQVALPFAAAAPADVVANVLGAVAAQPPAIVGRAGREPVDAAAGAGPVGLQRPRVAALAGIEVLHPLGADADRSVATGADQLVRHDAPVHCSGVILARTGRSSARLIGAGECAGRVNRGR